MAITPPWVDADVDLYGAVVIGWRCHLVSIAILAFVGPLLIILSPIIIPLCVIGSCVHLSIWVFRTLRFNGVCGLVREVHQFLRWLRRDLKDAWLDLKDAWR
jgi:hypothetical protein